MGFPDLFCMFTLGYGHVLHHYCVYIYIYIFYYLFIYLFIYTVL